MAYTYTVDERYGGTYVSRKAGQYDAANSLGNGYILGQYQTAYGALVISGFTSDKDVYAIGSQSTGTISVSASSYIWDLSSTLYGTSSGWWTWTPTVYIYNSSGQQVASGFGSASYKIDYLHAGNFYVGVEGATYSSSQYELSYSATTAFNYLPTVGSLAITGATTAGSLLTLTGIFYDANGVSLANSTSGYTYSWYTSTDNSTNWVLVGSGSSYLLKSSDLGKYIGAVISYRDDDGFSELIAPLNVLIPSQADTTPPTITYRSSKTSLGLGDTALITFTLSEPSVNFTASDVTVAGGTLTNFSGSGTSYTATFTPAVNSTNNGVINVNSGVFTDAAGNANTTPMTLSLTVNTVPADTTPPTIAYTTNKTSLSTGDTALITFTLSESSVNFTASDVTVTGGTLTNFSGSGTSYTATFTPAVNSTNNGVINVNSGVFTDAAGNANTTPMTLSLTVNTTVSAITHGSAGADTFNLTKGNDTLDGGAGIDTVNVGGALNAYSIKHTNTGITLSDKGGATGLDTLINIERLTFTDTSLALDLDGNAGITAKILGAVFGKQSVQNKSFVGIGLSYLDAGWTYDNLAGLALAAAGATTKDQIVTLLWTNVIGSPPSAQDKAPFVALLENGMSPGALAHLAADTAYNTNNINLVGLAQTGIEFTPA
jgi:hypothetical protein